MGLLGILLAFDSLAGQVVINHDLTNIWTTKQHERYPYDPNDEHYPDRHEDQLIERSLIEIKESGADQVSFAPGLGWVPMWQSNYYPVDLHAAWWQQTFGFDPSGAFYNYIKNGGDTIKTAVEVSQRIGLKLIINLRMNDAHDIARLPDALSESSSGDNSKLEKLSYSISPIIYTNETSYPAVEDCDIPDIFGTGNFHKYLKICED